MIGINMVYKIGEVEKAFTQSHQDSATNELQRGINAVIAKANDIAGKLALWDETSQQLTDPTYYRFWRQRRVHAVQSIPDYINVIELYTSHGVALLIPQENLMPNQVPDQTEYFESGNDRPWLYVFKPILLHENSNEILGYVGVKLDVMTALLELTLFSHLDSSSLSFTMPDSQRILLHDLIQYAHSEELHYGELEQLKYVIYGTFEYIVILIIVILVVLYWLVIVLLAKPLIKLNKYIESTKHTPISRMAPDETLNFPVTELNNFSRSLQEYQILLNCSQTSLQDLNNDLEKKIKNRTAELQIINNELEAFSYSVSHDLRAPLRSIDGFSLALLEDYGDKLDDSGKDYLLRVRSNAQQMALLIDDLINIARISRIEMKKSVVDLSALARKILDKLRIQHPQHIANFRVSDNLYADGDEQLLSVLLENLLGNAWKYSGKSAKPMIEFGRTEQDNETVFYVKDNGIGFDMKYVSKVFEVFQRLHGREYEGTGIGMATVSRIIKRHNGRIWAESKPGEGACFYFTLNSS